MTQDIYRVVNHDEWSGNFHHNKLFQQNTKDENNRKFYLNCFIDVQSLKSYCLHISEVCHELLVSSKGGVKVDEVQRDLGGMDEGEGDLGGI